MFNIKGLLGKIQTVYTADIQMRTTGARIFKESIGMDIPADKIEYKSNILYVHGVSQAAKATIFLKKQIILDALRAQDYFVRIKDVR